MNKELSHGNLKNVSILTADIKKAREISRIFRKIGILPNVYQDLEAFWYESIESMPSLSIIDVRLSSNENLVLKDHPFIKEEQLPVAFLFNESTRPLTYSTHDIFHFGHINSDHNLFGQIEAVVNRVGKVMGLEKRIQNYKIDKIRLDDQLSRVVNGIEDLKEKDFFNNYLDELINKLEAQKKVQRSFFEVCAEVFNNQKEFKKFSFMDLSENNKRLISPKIKSFKYKELPGLWLGKNCKDGIDSHALNMASQVAVDFLNADMMSLSIKGEHNQDRKIIFLEVSDDILMEKFNWDKLEKFLSGINHYYDSNMKEYKNHEKKDLSSWELLSYLGSLSDGEDAVKTSDFNKTLIDIDFTNLVDAGLAVAKQNGFSWEDFYNQFFGELSRRFDCDMKIAQMGTDHTALLLNDTDINEFFPQIKSFVLRYPFWKFFKNTEIILSKNLKPTVKLAPMGMEAYYDFARGIEKKDILPDINEIQERNKKIIWGDGPRPTI